MPKTNLTLTPSLIIEVDVTYEQPQTATLEREPIQGGIESVEVVGIVKGTLHEFGDYCFWKGKFQHQYEEYIISLLKTAQREHANDL